MPKKALPAIAVAPIDVLTAPSPPSPLIQKLRTDWRWAAISQFVWMFSDAFGLVDWDIQNLEADMDGDKTHLLPDLLAKLLYALTYNRQINRENVIEHVRKQHLKRLLEASVLGTLEEPIEWGTLGLGQKVEIIHQLCEWQMVNAERFRALLKSEDEEVSWRIDPVGWDKDGNTYFLFDDNRLWVQRLPPQPPPPARPPKKSSLKAKKALKRSRPIPASEIEKPKPRKAPAPLPTPSPEPAPEESVSGSRKRTQVTFYGNLTPTVEALRRGARLPPTPENSKATRSSSRRAGAEPVLPSVTVTPTKSSSTSRGRRVSKRFSNAEDEWEEIPEEWLKPVRPATKHIPRKAKDEAGSGEESELSDLTDEDEHEAILRASRVTASTIDEAPTNSPDASGKPSGVVSEDSTGKAVVRYKSDDSEDLTPVPEVEIGTNVEPASNEHDADQDIAPDETIDVKPGVNGEGLVEQEEEPTSAIEQQKAESEGNVAEDPEVVTDEVKLAVLEANDLPSGFVEWEAVCVTLYDWRTFPERFAKSRDPDEKDLYHLLKVLVGPQIIGVLIAKEQERIRLEAINNRKRSSRIATKELEKEEIMRVEKAQREMEERMSRAQREEDRKVYEANQIISAEKSREERLREREERQAARAQAALDHAIQEREDIERAVAARERRKRKREGRPDSDSESGDETDRGRRTPELAGATTAKSAGDRWELACEICRKTGWNIDGDLDLVSCDDCGKWQHVDCLDRQDAVEGKRKRNWDEVEFKCKDCRRRAARERPHQLSSSPIVDGSLHSKPTHNGHAPLPSGLNRQYSTAHRPTPNESGPQYHNVPPSNPPHLAGPSHRPASHSGQILLQQYPPTAPANSYHQSSAPHLGHVQMSPHAYSQQPRLSRPTQSHPGSYSLHIGPQSQIPPQLRTVQGAVPHNASHPFAPPTQYQHYPPRQPQPGPRTIYQVASFPGNHVNGHAQPQYGGSPAPHAPQHTQRPQQYPPVASHHQHQAFPNRQGPQLPPMQMQMHATQYHASQNGSHPGSTPPMRPAMSANGS